MASTKNRQNKSIFIVLALLGAIAFSVVIAFLTKDADIALLNPKGLIANEQYWLFMASTLIMLGFGVPVILTLYFFIWKYRENGKSAYNPDAKPNKALLAFAWGGPITIVIILASLMLPSTQRLEPQKPIESDKDQLTIQVVALNWKWLFIYPEQNIATVNFVQIPVDTPVRFELSADEAPMNSFWIPHLGGMLYAMTGHINPLHLMADTPGTYSGGAAEINGRGLAGMRFDTLVSSQAEFETWVEDIQTRPTLNESEYAELLKPSENNKPAFYSNPEPTLFMDIVGKYNSDHQHDSEEHGSH